MSENKDVLKEMFSVGAHYAFSRSRRHPSAKSRIFGTKNNVEIFDLEQTLEQLERAKAFVAKIASARGQILFVGGKPEARAIIAAAADRLNQPYVAGRWIGGTLTNSSQIRKRVNKLETLQKQKEKGELGKYTKKERLLIDREIEDLDETFGGLVSLVGMPAALLVVDSKHEAIAVAEAQKKNIPVISISGSDCDITHITYPISANDTAQASIRFFVDALVVAFESGRKAPVENSTEENARKSK